MQKFERQGERMKKSLRVVTATLFITMLVTVAVYGSLSDKLEVINHVSFGDINIGISEYSQKGTGEIAYKNPDKVVPGQVISKIPRITNYALPCWIRAKIENGGDTDKGEILTENNISGISAKWTKRGEYYYYTSVLKKGEKVDLFSSITIPSDWNKEHMLQNLNVDIKVDAIQAANFTPDFNAMSPWGNQKIQKCIHESNNVTTCKKGSTKLSVELSGKADKLLSVPDDFFINLNEAMPGDKLSEKISIANTTKKEAELFFQISTEDLNETQVKLLRKISFEIYNGNSKLYKGTLDAKSLNKAVSLGVYKPGHNGELNFKLEIPSELDNEYALKKTEVKWIFTANLKDDTDDGDSNQTSEKINYPDHKKNSSNSAKNAKTGDNTNITILLIISVLSGIIAFMVGRYILKGGRKV